QRRPERLPVHEIGGTPQRQSRVGVEAREGQVVVSAGAQDRRIRMVAGHHRVEEGAITEVGLALALEARPPLQAGPGRTTALARGRDRSAGAEEYAERFASRGRHRRPWNAA